MSAILQAAEVDGQPSHDDLRQMISYALNHGNEVWSGDHPYVIEVGDESCIIRHQGQDQRYPYTIENGKAVLGLPVRVKLSWKDANDNFVAADQARGAREVGQLAFVTDLRGVVFNDDTELVPIQVCRDGKWKHSKFGDVEVTEGVRDSFIANYKANVRKVGELPLDYDHELGPAPGWIVDLRKEGDALFADCRMTPSGRDKVRSGEYRFFSPEWSADWEDPETGKKHGPTLFGGALTNRPFFRGMAAINCSEIAPPAGGAASGAQPQGDAWMSTTAQPNGAQTVQMTEEAQRRLLALEDELKALKANEGRITAIEAENAVLKAKEERREIADAVETMKFSEGKAVLSPASRTALVDQLVKVPAEQRNGILEALKGFQFAELTELGHTGAETAAPGTLTATEERIVAGLAESMGVKFDEAKAKFIENKKKR